MKFKIFIFIFLAFLGFSEARLIDKLRDTRENIKEKWKERERSCEGCGKTIHTGTKCATCISKETAERTRQATEGTKQGFQGAREITNEVYRTVRERMPEVIEKTKEVYQKTNQGVQHLSNVAQIVYGRSLDIIGDPEIRQQASQTVGAVIELRKRYVEFKKEKTYETLNEISSIRVPVEGQMKSLGEIAGERLLEKYPSFNGTGVCDDPAATATALLCKDKEFLMSDLNLIKRGDRNVSIYEAIQESTPFDSRKAMTAFEIMASVEGIENALDSGSELPVEDVINLAEHLKKK